MRVIATSLPAVAATGSLAVCDLPSMNDAGFHRVLRKPLALADLLAAIESAMDAVVRHRAGVPSTPDG